MMDPNRISIRTKGGIDFLKMEDILCCVAHGRYTRIFTTSGKQYYMSKALKEIEVNLPCEQFFRTHKTYLININHIIKYQRNSNEPITLVNNMKVQLAKRRKQDFHKQIISTTHFL